jgi:hypothetical protein
MKMSISQVVLSLVAATGLSSCASNGTLSQEKVDNSMKKAASTISQAAQKTRESMKDIGPKMQGAKEKVETMGPALDKVGQHVKSAGRDLREAGVQLGKAINSTAKDIKQDLAEKTPAKSSSKTVNQ